MAKTDTLPQQKSEFNDFLEANKFLKERIDLDIDIYPGDEDLKTFQKIAKTIDAERYFTIYGCQSCVRDLIKFVYEKVESNGK
jgi:hypothetical protein